MNSVHQLDELVKEYLLFRGFINTFRAFEQENKTDKDKSFQADKIIDELSSYISNSDINGLLEYWQYLHIRYFSRLDGRFFGSVKKFETCLLRYYLVYATQHKRKDKIVEFFDTFGAELNGNPEWTKWFGLPFSKNPVSDPNFEPFFTKQWLDTFTVSLHNFLNAIFQNMPLPSLLCFNIDRLHRQTLQNEIKDLHRVIENLKSELETGDHEISTLKQKVARSEHATGYRRRRALSMVEHKEKNSNGVERLSAPSSRAKNQVSASVPVSRSVTPSKQHDAGSVNSNHNNKASQSPRSLPEERAISPISEYTFDEEDEGELQDDDETFIINSQELYLRHTSGITLAKFSCEGSLIASCDADNLVKIWSDSGESPGLEINNHEYNILSMEWESRSDKFLFFGTDERIIRMYNQESKSVVHEFQMEERLPRVNQICCSPAEPVFACSGSDVKIRRDNPGTGSAAGSSATSSALVSWDIKTMSIQGTFWLDTPSKSHAVPIETIKFNHNGKMLVTGDKTGYIRIFDIRKLSPIMEWNISSASSTINANKVGSGIVCSTLFSFDENSIYVVDESGQFSQCTLSFPFPTTFRKRTVSASSSRSTNSTATNVIGNNTNSNDNSNRGLSHLAPPPRAPMVAFSPDTEHLVCVGGTGGCEGMIYQTSNGEQVQSLASHSQSLTSVDWSATTGNAILTASTDGTLRLTKITKSELNH
ncbi:10897_t:CDS:10 [Ambispora gerdemannii]|uniref:10897_t:CDS:1 n=1 Tax=Ambispora gerdemannii TaxID=144530 RepID=A0A9N8V6T3_9GLOM|nr:10897_t:CDS:10 [Ambispora gerdemannii]